ncbi:MAG: parB-like partition protein [Frankiales bacterium]|nr:parB-like partition protein [Frankiales bacterium]
MPAAADVGVLRTISLRDLAEHPGNPREHFEDLENLAASMLEVGLLEPIIVERVPPAGYRLIAGARRVRAAKLVRITSLPAIIRPPLRNPVDAVAAMLIENGQRRNLDPIEEARGYARMIGLDPNLSQADIARRVGKSQTHVSMRLALLKLTPAEQEEVRRGTMLVRDAQQTARERAGTATQTRYTGWHLGKTHALAERVRARCLAGDHRDARTLGGMGCGACWEREIRLDERAQVLLEQQLTVDGHQVSVDGDERPATGPVGATA